MFIYLELPQCSSRRNTKIFTTFLSETSSQELPITNFEGFYKIFLCLTLFLSVEVKAKEWEIMSSLNFDISFPTYYNFFQRFFWKSFNSNVNSNYIRSIEETGIYILRMVLYNSTLMKFRPNLIGMAVLLLAIHTLFEELINKNKSHKDYLKAQEKEIVFIFTNIN